MTRVRAFGAFLYDFIVGDDWRVAIGVVCTLLVTWLLHQASVGAWWLVPVAVLGLLAMSVVTEARRASKR